jgi:hypothetical protein
VELPPGAPPSEQAAAAAIQKHIDAALFRLQATLDRKANTLTVKPSGMSSFRVDVTDDMFDPSKPINLAFFDKRWSGQVPLSARCVLEHYAQDRDATRLTYNVLECTVLGRVTALFEAGAGKAAAGNTPSPTPASSPSPSRAP